MILILFLAVLVGTSAVLQTGLNKVISERDGLSFAIHLSNIILLVAGIAILSIVPMIWKTDFANLLKFKYEPKSWTWWYIVPGLCSLLIVTIMPYAVYKVGAAKIFVAVIAAQVIGSLLWDYFVEGTPMDVWRVIGGALTCLGALALNFTKSA
jgi:uncharacterized membrane protein YdcZ (DUF606 family)